MASVASVVARTEFQNRLRSALKEKGLQGADIMRIYQPFEAYEPIECLIVDPSVGCVTVWCDPTGKIMHGPKRGFGLRRGETLDDD